MDNSGSERLRVPGFRGTPLDYELPGENRFAHGHDEWHQVPGATVRELAMVAAMNVITDKPNWNIDIFDDSIAKSWREEAEDAYPRLQSTDWPAKVKDLVLLSQTAWEWCLLKLRDKAREFEQKRFTQVLDTGCCVCESDSIVPASFANVLSSSLQIL